MRGRGGGLITYRYLYNMLGKNTYPRAIVEKTYFDYPQDDWNIDDFLFHKKYNCAYSFLVNFSFLNGPITLILYG